MQSITRNALGRLQTPAEANSQPFYATPQLKPSHIPDASANIRIINS